VLAGGAATSGTSLLATAGGGGRGIRRLSTSCTGAFQSAREPSICAPKCLEPMAAELSLAFRGPLPSRRGEADLCPGARPGAAIEWRDGGPRGAARYSRRRGAASGCFPTERFWGSSTHIGRAAGLRGGGSDPAGLGGQSRRLARGEDRQRRIHPFAGGRRTRVSAANPEVLVVATTHWLARARDLRRPMSPCCAARLRFRSESKPRPAPVAASPAGAPEGPGCARPSATASAKLAIDFSGRSRAGPRSTGTLARHVGQISAAPGRIRLDRKLGTTDRPGENAGGRVEMGPKPPPGGAPPLARDSVPWLAGPTSCSSGRRTIAKWELPAAHGPALRRDCAIPVAHAAGFAGDRPRGFARVRGATIRTDRRRRCDAMRRSTTAVRRGGRGWSCGLTTSIFVRGVGSHVFGRRCPRAHPMWRCLRGARTAAHPRHARSIRLPGGPLSHRDSRGRCLPKRLRRRIERSAGTTQLPGGNRHEAIGRVIRWIGVSGG